MRTRLVALLAAPLLVLSACGSEGASEPAAGETPTPSASGSAPSGSASSGSAPSEPAASSARPEVIGTVARGLEAPWGIAFLPDGSALVTERDTRRVFQVGDGEVEQVGTVEEAVPSSEGGLLGLAVSPTFEQDGRVFFYVSTEDDNRVLRTTFEDGRLGQAEPILTGIPVNTFHDGGQLLFGPDDRLYVSTGDAGDPALAQDRSSLAGKILRLTQDGEAAPGNPQGSRAWSWGHRNVQGLAFDDADRLWASEFGDQTTDELNLIERGGNYGWPEYEGAGDDPAFVDPQEEWTTDEASPSGLAFADGRLWMAALNGERLWRMDVAADGTRARADFLTEEYGRLRLVATAPDGNLWVATSNRDGRGDPADQDDLILLVRP